MQTFRRIGLSALFMICVGAAPCHGTVITLDAVDSGFYFANGRHNPAIENYLTGLFGTEHRSFVLFDLSSQNGEIRSATLRLFNPEVSEFLHGYVSPDPTETLNIYDVTTAASAIIGNTAGVGGFEDLGSGVLYGSKVVSAADNGFVVEIVLNTAALADLNSAAGLFLFGGALDTLTGTADQHVFGFSMADFVSDHTRQLVLDIRSVPEPSLLFATALGVLGLAWRERRWRRSGPGLRVP